MPSRVIYMGKYIQCSLCSQCQQALLYRILSHQLGSRTTAFYRILSIRTVDSIVFFSLLVCSSHSYRHRYEGQCTFAPRCYWIWPILKVKWKVFKRLFHHQPSNIRLFRHIRIEGLGARVRAKSNCMHLNWKSCSIELIMNRSFFWLYEL